MGQKINPKLLRIGPVYNWDSRWFEDKRYKDVLLEDIKIRKALYQHLKLAGVSKIEIERSINSIRITAYVLRVGIVVGKAGTGLEDLKKFILGILRDGKSQKYTPKLDIRIEPIKEPNLDAYLVARNVSDQIIKRLPYKRILNSTAEKIMSSGAKGVRILLSGRIGGAEIGRREKIQKGTVPLSTIRERISFASVPALTKKGYVGVKVWINRPEEKS
ncbi:MAG: 30S ribosomal protein S3 [Candidatus Levybacteria bacterium RIFCSPHIGHO2_12_FULL_38_12]|nr:MAG: 30S ribosomal protein S3 [Candidatus Levybacteria bacterium RIFCSPHIGHO2_01_FULL_38_12]OGH21968.1 MAG: 30S ribosomal protein S3 [Candidatus Levybacteria bacterium RIFCSPHIGHO2_02_FULL_37_18]OGH23040.1 MAG: 30S ribosomal protein S3 [Candidatus Levybacteria bacterium RIFCSPHIGHO2_12_FULL_38_12]OGH33661.1 MAG: 30S ribosomal protein S3 [Candidatus Levybacteria bacterium RIFCSPLOWO2_01_FULL_37_20]OGH44567.1 MAG: 30S ribosomal protein S3 [Candidatus Levybacteria bacterium RIFCSPLOWO2_02_FULL_